MIFIYFRVKARGVKKLDLSANEIETLRYNLHILSLFIQHININTILYYTLFIFVCRYLNLLGKAAPKLKELGLINNQISILYIIM